MNLGLVNQLKLLKLLFWIDSHSQHRHAFVSTKLDVVRPHSCRAIHFDHARVISRHDNAAAKL